MKLHPSINKGEAAGKPRQINSQLVEARKHSKSTSRRQEVMSSIFYAVEKAGALVKGNEDGAIITFQKQQIECRVFERLRKVRLPLTRFDLAYQGTHFKKGYRTGLEVTGLLAFEIDTYLRNKVRQIWQETPPIMLETMVADIAIAIQAGAEVRQAWQDEDVEREHKKDRENQIRQKSAQQTRVEDARWQLLVELSTASHDVEKVRGYIASFAAQDERDLDMIVGDRTLRQWMEWLDLMIEKRDGAQALANLFRRVHAVDIEL